MSSGSHLNEIYNTELVILIEIVDQKGNRDNVEEKEKDKLMIRKVN